MSSNPFVTEELIHTKVTEKSFERGEEYYDMGVVESVVRRGNRLFAEVLGSEEAPYDVGIWFREGDFDASCTCPYDWGGYCKHVVAVLLTWMRDRKLVSGRTPVEDMLLTLDTEKLKALILLMVVRNPKLPDIIDEFCHQGAPVG